jgi:hypothetical protein
LDKVGFIPHGRKGHYDEVWAGTTHCTTYQEKTLGRLQTLCDDGTRAIHT